MLRFGNRLIVILASSLY